MLYGHLIICSSLHILHHHTPNPWGTSWVFAAFVRAVATANPLVGLRGRIAGELALVAHLALPSRQVGFSSWTEIEPFKNHQANQAAKDSQGLLSKALADLITITCLIA